MKHSDTRSAQRDPLTWLKSYEHVQRRVGKHDLGALLDAGGGIAIIDDFFPKAVAEAVLELVTRVPASAWNDTSAADDTTQNNIDHKFWSVKQALGLPDVFRALALLAPDSLHTFSAAKYGSGHHIAPHDDRAYTQVCMADGTVTTCSRTVAVIYYLTAGWTEGMGGALVDLETGTTHVPRFNRVVAFRIPRWHEVTPVASPRPRYSVRGCGGSE